MDREKCKVLDCNDSSSNGQEGYCPTHFDELERIRKDNEEAYENDKNNN